MLPVLIAFGVIAVIALLNQNAAADIAPNALDEVTDYYPQPLSEVAVNWGIDPVKNTAMGISTTKLVAFADAVIPTEGQPGDLNYRNNNPGNLKYAGQPGATGADANGFAVFPTFAAGQQALQNQLAKNARDFPQFSLLQWAKHYLGMDPNSPIAVTSQGNALTKAQSIADALGVSVNTTLSQLLGV